MSDSNWKQIGAAGGIAFVVLQVVGQVLIQVGGTEPAFNAAAPETLEFFETRSPRLFEVGGYLSALSAIALLWFLGSLWSTLRTAEGEPGWLSTVALGSGLVVVAVSAIAGSGWALAVFRIGEGLDPQLARFQFDFGNFGFATIWVMLASFLLASSAVALRTAALPRWIGWMGLVIAILLLIARAFWAAPSGAIFLPYLLFWIWLIATSVILIRQARRQGQPEEKPAG